MAGLWSLWGQLWPAQTGSLLDFQARLLAVRQTRAQDEDSRQH